MMGLEMHKSLNYYLLLQAQKNTLIINNKK